MGLFTGWPRGEQGEGNAGASEKRLCVAWMDTLQRSCDAEARSMGHAGIFSETAMVCFSRW
jgi:hypothetical protein